MTAAASPGIDQDPRTAARAAGLRYVSDAAPGIRRRRAGRGFVYVGPDGARIDDLEELGRIRSLVVPPAWTDVWICVIERGHLQATGRDARGRKQYRYHTDWRRIRDETKYGRLAAFGGALPNLRRRVARDLSTDGLPREKVVAAVVRMLDVTLIRPGNAEYARDNGSYGLTTLLDDHVDVFGAEIRFGFRGKGGKEHQVRISDRRLAGVVRRCQELPGEALFQYVDEEGRRRAIDSGDVNDYVKDVTGEEFTAKDFRTWGGSVLTAAALHRAGSPSSGSEAATAAMLAEAIRKVAKALGNTPAVCRNCYVHPAVIEAYRDGLLDGVWERAGRPGSRSAGLRKEEVFLLDLLRRRRARAAA